MATPKVVKRQIKVVTALPTEGDFVVLGTWAYDDDGNLQFQNVRYGPIDATICRDWFSYPARYNVNFFFGVEEP